MSTPHERRKKPRGKYVHLTTPDAQHDYFSQIAKHGNAHRVVLSGEEKRALAEACALLHHIAVRHGLDPGDM